MHLGSVLLVAAHDKRLRILFTNKQIGVVVILSRLLFVAFVGLSDNIIFLLLKIDLDDGFKWNGRLLFQCCFSLKK